MVVENKVKNQLKHCVSSYVDCNVELEVIEGGKYFAAKYRIRMDFHP
jgi:hypothetical protein